MATSSTTELGVAATRRCIHEWGGDPNRIGLLVAATNTPDQMLPCLASESWGKRMGSSQDPCELSACKLRVVLCYSSQSKLLSGT